MFTRLNASGKYVILATEGNWAAALQLIDTPIATGGQKKKQNFQRISTGGGLLLFGEQTRLDISEKEKQIAKKQATQAEKENKRREREQHEQPLRKLLQQFGYCPEDVAGKTSKLICKQCKHLLLPMMSISRGKERK